MFRFTSLCFLALLPWAVALPTGAPVCTTSQSAPGGPHLPPDTEGPIALGGLTVSIGGEELFDDMEYSVVTGVQYEVVISTPTFFRGVLAIIGGGDSGVDTTGALTLMGGETDLQVSSVCASNGVSLLSIFRRSSCFAFP